MGCKTPGVYGSACDIPCPVACKDNICNIQGGVCLESKHGVCGSYCNQSCPNNCKVNICHGQNGTCFTCEPGWTGMYCTTGIIAQRTRN